ncbi:porin [Rhodocyclus tenuis]|uniref:Putative porin n=1 Tax=Rhodocyclus tenuis TaxID=1066 RepID=A0A840G221_RHOTE|nr:porin [Rhodocyclus tenuis]MBB4245995.1 putative porin [Rhodocyclus tenuis]
MHKKIIALAVAGLLSGGAFAQSNVSIYGIVDLYGAHRTADNARAQNGVDSGGLATSRIGFKGEEALGNGLSAVFTLEYGLDVDKNTGVGATAHMARQQFVGLKSGSLGTLVAGRLQGLSYYTVAAFAGGVGGGPLSPLASLQTSANNGTATVGALQASITRFNNGIAYTSPNFAGFDFGAAYSFGNRASGAEATTADTRDSVYELGANYKNGPIAAGYVFSRAVDKLLAGGSDDLKLNAHFLGASYDFGLAKLKASFQTQKNETGGSESGKFDIWQLGVDVPVTAAGTIRAAYVAYNDKFDTRKADDAKSWTVGYTHALSKRTTAYAAYTVVRNDNNAGLKLFGSGDTVTGMAPVAGGDSSVIGCGVSHAF